MTNLTVGQYSLNLPNVPGGLGNAAGAGQFLAMVVPAVVPGGEGESLEKMTAQQILAKFCKGSVKEEFPAQYAGRTLENIRQLAKARVPFAQKALKLLTRLEYRK
jgi:hypothetical protein